MSRHWLDYEIEYLQNSWGDISISTIAKKLDRTVNAIIVKSKRLKLGSFIASSEYLTAKQVATILKIDSHAVIDYWVAKCGLQCKNIKSKKRIIYWVFDFEILLDWLKHNQDKWDSRRVELYDLGMEYDWLKEKRKRDLKIPKNRFQKWTATEDERLIFLYKKGEGNSFIADQMNRSVPSVKHRLSRLGVYSGKYMRDKK